jgi:FtsH-binding integral membrane protein
MLFGIGIKAMFFYGHEANVESKPILGITLPLWMGIGGMILGFVLMVISRPYFKAFFSRKAETAPPGILDQPPAEALPAQVDF